MSNDIPLAIFEFQWYADSPNGKYKSIRFIKERGYKRALKKFKSEFIDWNEPVPENIELHDIKMVQNQ